MICITGDTHSEFSRFTRSRFPDQAGMTKGDYVIIAGDFGGVWYPYVDLKRRKAEDYNLDELNQRPFTTLFVPGNHENYARLMSAEFPTLQWHGGLVKAIRPSVLMLMRGEMYDIDGARFFAFGGAQSHDISDGLLDADDPEWRLKAQRLKYRRKLYFRVKGLSWWPEELPSDEEMRHGLQTLDAHGWEADYVITHCAPTSVQALLGRDDSDALTDYLEAIQKRLRFKKWFFGHYHRNLLVGDRHVLLYEAMLRLR